MMKVKMLFRHHGNVGKMEKGLVYSVPADYALELISHGLAEPVIDPVMAEKPIHMTAKEIGHVRTRSGRFMPKNQKG